MDLQLTAGQQQALSGLRTWWLDPSRNEARVDGVAGSGKTTLIGYFLRDVDTEYAVGVATTGRAAKVARGKFGCRTMTISQAFFKPVRVSTEASIALELELEQDLRSGLVLHDSPEHQKRLVEIAVAEDEAYEERLSNEVQNANLLIVDEHSMVSLYYRDVMRRANKKTLLIGDPFQLPSPDFSSREQDHCEYQEGRLAYHDLAPLCTLTEVVRTERNENGFNICEAAASLRRGTMPEIGDEPGLNVRTDNINRMVSDSGLLRTMFNADATIAGRHHTRHALIRAVRREVLGTDIASIGDGDKLLVTRNVPGLGLYNGDLLTVGTDIQLHAVMPPLIDGGCSFLHLWTDRLEIRRAKMWFTQDRLERVYGAGNVKVPLPDTVEMACATTMFEWPYEPYVDYRRAAKQASDDSVRLGYQISVKKMPLTMIHLEYGHVITCHKAQGSEFDRVVVVDDGWGSGNNPELLYRWRYTALTRARSHCLYTMTGRFADLSDIVASMFRPSRTDREG